MKRGKKYSVDVKLMIKTSVFGNSILHQSTSFISPAKNVKFITKKNNRSKEREDKKAIFQRVIGIYLYELKQSEPQMACACISTTL
ncbi:hypothetical protein VIGAN_03276000 [Vigna angularis var. angularis]|uniref:Uncharacterized protein n=1 Tax=Vigna angularis var. angularis TaxID=157739 RepID=A0A0S3RQ56_PHAAN|nr:hypothetical protein VIGAN_03276000 [Vigna angularis var. angularis]